MGGTLLALFIRCVRREAARIDGTAISRTRISSSTQVLSPRRVDVRRKYDPLGRQDENTSSEGGEGERAALPHRALSVRKALQADESARGLPQRRFWKDASSGMPNDLPYTARLLPPAAGVAKHGQRREA